MEGLGSLREGFIGISGIIQAGGWRNISEFYRLSIDDKNESTA